MDLQRSLPADRATERRRRGIDLRDILARYGTLIALVLLVIVATVLSPRFLTTANLMNVLRQTSIVGVLGIGMTFVILTAGIDLSVGAILAVSVVLLGGTLERTGNIWLAIAIAPAAGMAIGLVNGLGVTWGRVQPFVMTLGMLGIARSLAFLYTGGEPVPILDMSFLRFGIGYIAGIPIPSVVFLVLLGAAALVLHYTPFGRYIYAIGSNAEAARLSGINVRLYTILVYVLSGATASVAAILYGAQFAAAPAIAGEGYELDAIAAVVVGGTSLFGGQGGVIGTFLGALIIGILSNILNLTGVSPFAQPLAKGALIIAAVWIVGRGQRA
ncbi:MAG: ABC transporter permease [Chloroflexia bacterium]|jgi:ribose/xylose/arabinose/galactoside ABC-type transport system permease subunit|nr:ABC transporter permease [Chloroflexia bacterium]